MTNNLTNKVTDLENYSYVDPVLRTFLDQNRMYLLSLHLNIPISSILFIN